MERFDPNFTPNTSDLDGALARHLMISICVTIYNHLVRCISTGCVLLALNVGKRSHIAFANSSHSDALGAGRRYAFRQQPQVCYWNLLQLAAAFVRAEILEQVGLPWSTASSAHCVDRWL